MDKCTKIWRKRIYSYLCKHEELLFTLKTENMKVLIIIVSYNFTRWMNLCLGHLRRSTVPVDVIVIDNGSQDNTREKIEKDYPEVRLIKNKTNKGFGEANNQGISIAIQEGYDAVYLLNQDAWIMPDTIEKLIQASRKHPEFGILSPVHLQKSEQELESGFAAYARKSLKEIQRTKDVTEIPFVNAAHWFIPVSVLKVTGGFSPLFHMYGEDVDMMNRMHFYGFKSGYVPDALAVHDREGRPITYAVLERSRFVYLLSEYSNINRSFPAAFAYSVLASVKSFFIAIGKGAWPDAEMYVKIGLHLLGKTWSVKKTRHIISRKGAHFLSVKASVQ